MAENNDEGATPEQRAAVLRKLYGDSNRMSPVPPPKRDPEPVDPGAATLSQWRFGVTLLVFGAYILVLYFALPDDTRREPFIGFSLIAIFAAGVVIDRANKRLRATSKQRSGSNSGSPPRS